MEYLGDVQWVFNKTDKINDITTLKSNVMGALKNADRTAIRALDEISVDQVKKLLGDNFGDIDEVNQYQKILQALEDDKFFELIFKIAE